MKILLKIEVVNNPELTVNIGLKNTYHEFDLIEDAIKWLFENKLQIKSYKIFSIEEFKSRKDVVSDSSNISAGEGIKLNSINSRAYFQ